MTRQPGAAAPVQDALRNRIRWAIPDPIHIETIMVLIGVLSDKDWSDLAVAANSSKQEDI